MSFGKVPPPDEKFDNKTELGLILEVYAPCLWRGGAWSSRLASPPRPNDIFGCFKVLVVIACTKSDVPRSLLVVASTRTPSR